MLFQDLNRPVDHMAEGGENQDTMQYRIIGILALIMGGFLLFCILIPNPLYGRACFLLIGGILSGVGLLLLRSSRKSGILDNESNK